MFSSALSDLSPEEKVVEKALAVKKPYQFIKITVNGNELCAINDSNNVKFPVMDVTVTVSPDEKEASSIKLHEINSTTAKFFDSVNEEYSVEIFFPLGC